MALLNETFLQASSLELSQVEKQLGQHGFRHGVSFFGSARLREKDGLGLSRHIPAARELSQRVAKRGREKIGPGFGLISGGGPGIMQAVNEGATAAGFFPSG